MDRHQPPHRARARLQPDPTTPPPTAAITSSHLLVPSASSTTYFPRRNPVRKPDMLASTHRVLADTTLIPTSNGRSVIEAILPDERFRKPQQLLLLQPQQNLISAAANVIHRKEACRWMLPGGCFFIWFFFFFVFYLFFLFFFFFFPFLFLRNRFLIYFDSLLASFDLFIFTFFCLCYFSFDTQLPLPIQ